MGVDKKAITGLLAYMNIEIIYGAAYTDYMHLCVSITPRIVDTWIYEMQNCIDAPMDIDLESIIWLWWLLSTKRYKAASSKLP